jgi:dihydroorotate dehydrogenase
MVVKTNFIEDYKMKKFGFELPNGFEIKPIVLDCCLGVDGFGAPGILFDTFNDFIDREHSTTISKSITRHPKVGNYGASIFSKSGWAKTQYGFYLPKKMCYLPIGNGSTVNSFGLTNDGFDDFLNLDFANDYVIPSIFLEFGKGEKEDIVRVKEEAMYMGEKLRANFCSDEPSYFLSAVVLNISCPNSGHDVCMINKEIVEVVKIFKEAIGDVPVGIKYSYLQDISLAVMLDKEVDIAFHQAINTIPFKFVFGDKKFSPLSHIGHGGVSGPAIKEYALDYLIRLREALPSAKIIGGGGISSIEDAEERFKYCDSIALGILVNRDPIKANQIIDEFDL